MITLNAMTLDQLPLHGKSALVTGVSRRKGIGHAIAVRFAELGANVFIHHYAPHDDAQTWGSDDIDRVSESIKQAQQPGAQFSDLSIDLGLAESPEKLLTAALSLTGRLDVMVCNHAQSGNDGSIFDMTPAALDSHWSVNTRSTLLLTSLFAQAFTGVNNLRFTQPGQRTPPTRKLDEHSTGRIFWLTSGQVHGPMPGEVAYAASKAAIAGITATVASELLPHGIIVNTINPGPVNTGYLDLETTDRPAHEIEKILATMPFGRFGHPQDTARLIGWLASDEGRWVVGQTITSDGGFSLRQ